MISSKTRALFLSLMLSCVFACGRQVVEFGVPGPLDASPAPVDAAVFGDAATDASTEAAPTVTSTLPVNGGMEVATNTSIYATFSKAMDPATITLLSFTVRQGATLVVGAVTFNGATATATFTPAAALGSSLFYTATITTGAKDTGGRPLAANYSWLFSTTASRTPPTVLSTTPLNAATNVPTGTRPTATFSKAMDPTTIDIGTFSLKLGGVPVAGVVTLDGATNTATFAPMTALGTGLVYTATITTGAKGLGGLPLAADYTWSFTTAPSELPPKVIFANPLDAATNVPVGTKPTATFSKAMEPTTIDGGTFSLKLGGTPVSGVVTWDGTTNTATFTPTTALGADLVYTATITTGAKDSGGLALAADYTWSFTTEFLPTVIVTNPLDLETNVSINTKPIAVFSKAMDPTTIDGGTFSLKLGGVPVAGVVTLDGAAHTATFDPIAALGTGLVYTATITTGAKDSGGLALAADYTWSFTTAPSELPPTVIFTNPLNLETNVSINTKPIAVFSKAMDPTTIDGGTFSLKLGGVPVAGVVTLDGAAHTATFTPMTALGTGLVYTATITTGAKDLGGLPLAADYTWSFTTAPSELPPKVIFTNPLDLETNVSINTKPIAVFSKAMEPTTIDGGTFSLKLGGVPVAGVVTLDGAAHTATFTPMTVLGTGLVYTATITTGAKDLGGLPLAADYTWSFTTATSELPPKVIFTNPLDAAANVPVGTKPTATFSKAMEPTTIDGGTFSLKLGGTPVSGVVTWDGTTNTATFTPMTALGADLVYTATITTGAKDSGGLPLAADYTWSFTTEFLPTVIVTNPLDLETNVSINTKPIAVFSKAMDPTTIDGGTFSLKLGGVPVAGVVTLDGAAHTATFAPTTALGSNQVYMATITTGAKDLGGLPLAADYTWSFTTATSELPPKVILTTPQDLATNVPVGTKPTATFSKAMEPTTIDGGTFSLTQGGTPVSGVVTWDGTTNTATFTPMTLLGTGLVYTATITTGAKDSGGLPLAANYTWSFTTEFLPTVISTNPLDLETNVSINIKPVAIFSKAMDPATIDGGTFSLKLGGVPVAGVVTLDGAAHTATFAPMAALGSKQVYTATITTGAKDSGGLQLAADYTWSFTTATSELPPKVIFTTPQDLATNVAVNKRPTATFSKAMDPMTIDGGTFSLTQGGAPVAGVVTLDGATNVATFTPTTALGISLLYTATITTGAKDSGGLPLAADYTWSFTTGACSLAPVILGSASAFAVLGGATVTNALLTHITGDLGVSPGPAVTGFPPGVIVGMIHAGDSTAAIGIADLTTAYNNAAGRTLCSIIEMGNLGGMTLAPGLYTSTSSLEISSGDLTLDAGGDGDAIFIFQMASTLTTTPGRQVILTNGAKAANIFWQVGSSATLGTTSAFQGTIMADQSISLNTGATLTGRALAHIGAVTLDTNTIVLPAP